MESRIHRLERLFCYILLVFVGFVDLIHGSLSGNNSRGTSRSSSSSTTTTTTNSSSSGNRNGEGRSNDNNSDNNDNNRNNSNGNQTSNNRENSFKSVFLGEHLPPQRRQPPTSHGHQQQHKNIMDNALFLRRGLSKKDEKEMSIPLNITIPTAIIRNTSDFTSGSRGQIFRNINLINNDPNGTVLQVEAKNIMNARHLLWLLGDKGRFRQKRRQHVAVPRQSLLYKNSEKTGKEVYFSTPDQYGILNATAVKINVKAYKKNNKKKERNYFLHNATKKSEKRVPDLLLSDQAVTARNADSAPESERYGDFNPPEQISFLKKPPSYDFSETGHTLTYECEVDTSNLTVDPEIYWTIPDRITKEKKGPEDLYPGEFRHDVYVDHNHTLIIKNVQMEHRGMYICVASVGQRTEMVTMVLRVKRVSGFDLFVRLIVGFSVAFVVIVGFGSVWMVLRVLNNRKNRAEEGLTETTEIRRQTPDVHYFL